MNFLKMEKEKNVLKLYFEGYETRPIKYDFNEKKLYGVSGKSIKQLGNKFKGLHLGNATYLERYMYNKLENYWRDGDDYNQYWVNLLSNAEQYWDYKDIFRSMPICGNIPKGYIKFCKDNNYNISQNSMELFKLQHLLKEGYNNAERAVIEDMLKHRSASHVKAFLEILNKDYVKKMIHIWDENYIYDWIDLHSRIMNNTYYLDHCAEYLDPSRDVIYNDRNFKAWKESYDNQALTMQQMRFKSIETVETESLCIKVPTTPAEFIDEGKQQNNCVGHYYHESIKRGENVIYFIRRKSKPNKSYITCRFNLGHNDSAYRTIEMRTVNNGWEVEDEIEVAEMLNKADAAIINILKANKGE